MDARKGVLKFSTLSARTKLLFSNSSYSTHRLTQTVPHCTSSQRPQHYSSAAAFIPGCPVQHPRSSWRWNTAVSLHVVGQKYRFLRQRSPSCASRFCSSPPIKRSHPKMSSSVQRQTRPVLIADVMNTLVVDPFFNGMHEHFGFTSFEDFVSAKTPNLWISFERGEIDEEEVARNFFKDNRLVDLQDFKRFLRSSYRLMPGASHMLNALRDAHVEVHLCSNYPVWACMVEEALDMEKRFGVHWTFVSGCEGVRKPEKEAFLCTARKASVQPSSCVLLDDSSSNCDGAIAAGYMDVVHFKSCSQAQLKLHDLFERNGVSVQF